MNKELRFSLPPLRLLLFLSLSPSVSPPHIKAQPWNMLCTLFSLKNFIPFSSPPTHLNWFLVNFLLRSKLPNKKCKSHNTQLREFSQMDTHVQPGSFHNPGKVSGAPLASLSWGHLSLPPGPVTTPLRLFPQDSPQPGCGNLQASAACGRQIKDKPILCLLLSEILMEIYGAILFIYFSDFECYLLTH